MLHKLKKQAQGFTIIEVLIVLAIAGLILLIVFLAVPALQRNSRNTQIRNDVSTVVGYVNEYASNNNGALPGGVCSQGTAGDIHMSTDGTCTTADPLAGKIRGGITVSSNTTGDAEDTLQQITVALTRKCNGSNPDTNNANANTRAFSASYRVETAAGGTGNAQCVES